MRSPDRIRIPAASMLALLAALHGPAAGQTPGSLEELGRLETPASTAVASWADLVLIGTETGLLIQDLSQPAVPVTLHEVNLGGAASSIAVHGDSARVELTAGGTVLVHLAAAGGPESSPWPADLFWPNLWRDGQPYLVTDEQDTLRVHALAGGSPEPVGFAVLEGSHRGLAVESGLAYVLTDVRVSYGSYVERYTRLNAVSLAEPASPVLLGVFDPADLGWTELYKTFAVEEGMVYAITTGGAMRCLDFRDPASPQGRGTVSTTLRGDILLRVAGDRALVGGNEGGAVTFKLRVFDVSDPSLPRTRQYHQDEEAWLRDLVLHGDLVLVATSKALHVFAIGSAPGPLHDLGYSHPVLTADRMAAVRDAVHLVDTSGPAELVTVSVENPGLPVLASAVPRYREEEPRLHATDRALYLVYPGFGVGMYDLSVPWSPQPVRFWEQGGELYDVAPRDSLLAARYAGGVNLFGLQDPFDPVFMGYVPARPRWTVWRGDALVLAQEGYEGYGDYADTLRVIDASDPASPVEIGRLGQNFLLRHGLTLGERLFVRGEEYGVWEGDVDVLYDLSDPALPARVGLEDGDAFWPATSVLGHHLGWKGATLTVRDLGGGLSAPAVIAQWTGDFTIELVAVAGERVFAYGPGRLAVLEFSPDAVPPAVVLSIEPGAMDPARLFAVVEVDEPVALPELWLGATPLDGMATSDTRFVFAIPAGTTDRVTLSCRVCDAGGNTATATRTCSLGAAGPAGGFVSDTMLGLYFQFPPGALAEDLALVLTRLEEAPGKAPGDTAYFRIEPAVNLAVPAVATMAATPGSLPELSLLVADAWESLPLRLDRSSGTARIFVDRLDRFRLVRAVPLVPASRLRLLPAAPNPFNARTNLAFELAAEGPVTLRLYDLRGRLVRTLHDGVLAAGRHGFDWDGRDDAGRGVGSGVYFFRLTGRGGERTGRCALVK